jgi:prolyl-tRNA editing enzyme YbaK/EbsC (Cys-tRNA(Pro) deacylase)
MLFLVFLRCMLLLLQASLVAQPADVSPSQIIKSMVMVIKDAASNAATSASTTSSNSSSNSSTSTWSDSESDSSPAGVEAPAAVLVLLTDEVRVDERAVAQQLGLPRKRLRLASRQEAAAATGYEVGSIPPFGE